MIRNEIAQILLGLGVSLATTTVHAQCAPAAQRLIADRKYEAVRVQLEAQIKRAPSDDVAMHCKGPPAP